MKKSVLIFFTSLLLMKHARAIGFFDGSYGEALAQAKVENKLLFIYFTASWCGPCVYMQKYIFPDPELSAYTKLHYIAVKIDIGKEDGRLLLNKFTHGKRQGVPAYFIINAREEILKSAIGGMKYNQFKMFLLYDRSRASRTQYKVLADSVARGKMEQPRSKPAFFSRLLYNAAASKWKTGIRAGINLMQLHGGGPGTRLRPGYELGLFFDRSLRRYTFQPAILLASKGGYLKQNGIDTRINIQYLELCLSNGYLVKPLYPLKISVNPYAGLALWGKATMKDGKQAINFGNEFSKTDYGIKIGLSAYLGSFEPYIGYNLGLNNIDRATGSKMYTRGFYFSIALIPGK